MGQKSAISMNGFKILLVDNKRKWEKGKMGEEREKRRISLS